MTEKITIEKTIIDKLIEKSNVEPTGNTDDLNITNPAWVDGYKEGILQAVNAVMGPIYLTDHQPAFAVGEYVAAQHPTNGLTIIKIETKESNAIRGKMYDLINGIFNEDLKSFVHVVSCSPATTEQIATFRRAEQFASKGREMDEFRDRDIVKYEGELFFAKTTSESNLISVSGFDGYGWDDMNADEFDLIQTAEELQEVGESQ